MMFDTLLIELCTGRALVCLYCTNPNTAPTAHTKMPRYMSISPLTPPKPANRTWVRSGILMSASLAEALHARPIVITATHRALPNRIIDLVAIILRGETMQEATAVAKLFLAGRPRFLQDGSGLGAPSTAAARRSVLASDLHGSWVAASAGVRSM